MLPGDSTDFDIGSTPLPEKSRLTSPKLKSSPDTIVVTHDWTFSTTLKDFLTVAFFYKIDGVLPKKVNVTVD